MKIAVVGATGRTGLQVTGQALARGDDVIALARHPEALPRLGPGMASAAADVLDRAVLAEALAGPTPSCRHSGSARPASPSSSAPTGPRTCCTRWTPTGSASSPSSPPSRPAPRGAAVPAAADDHPRPGARVRRYLRRHAQDGGAAARQRPGLGLPAPTTAGQQESDRTLPPGREPATTQSAPHHLRRPGHRPAGLPHPPRPLPPGRIRRQLTSAAPVPATTGGTRA